MYEGFGAVFVYADVLVADVVVCSIAAEIRTYKHSASATHISKHFRCSVGALGRNTVLAGYLALAFQLPYASGKSGYL